MIVYKITNKINGKVYIRLHNKKFRSAVSKVANGIWEHTKGYKFQNLSEEHLIF